MSFFNALKFFVGDMAFQSSRGLVIRPQTVANPTMPGDLVVLRTSDTVLTLKYKGMDGVIRSCTLTFT